VPAISRASTTAPKPTRRRMRAIRDRLRAYYGRPRNEPHHAPLDELVLTVLSQNTTDRNRDVAYARLRARFPDWRAVLDAHVDDVEEAIRPGGISRVKARRIQDMLATIAEETGGLDLDRLATTPREDAIEFLESLPGVGRKTAACVLLFSFDRPELPVDTHVYRVASRLGLIRPKASFEEAHDVLLDLSDPADVYELHVNLIRHGRRLCAARNPRCPECPLLRLCPYGRERVRQVQSHRSSTASGPG
jgi:endonuclease-3